MLTKIYCEEFKSNGVPRGIIHFNKGLNTVLGGKAAENSIGKSTFLLAVDFAFGGSTFASSEAARENENHYICFTFEFDGQEYHFSRGLSDHNYVYVCDDDTYKRTDNKIKIKEFLIFLKEKYKMNLPELSFRDSAGRYMRIHGKENVKDPKLPLNSTSREQGAKAITALEKLFDVYNVVKSFKDAEDLANDKLKAIKNARKYGFVSNHITTEKQLEKCENRIEELQSSIESLIEKEDSDLTKEQLNYTHQVESIKKNIEYLKRKYRKIKSDYNVIRLNMDGKALPVENDLNELAEFFPNTDFRKIEEIENFHYNISNILKNELEESERNLSNILYEIEKQIAEEEEKIRAFGVPSNISAKFLDEYNEKQYELEQLKENKTAFLSNKECKEELDNVKKQREETETGVLKDVASKINQQMVKSNEYIYGEEYYAPVIDLKNGKSYDFHTPKDDGTGTAYKSWIVFDLAVLQLTKLPVLIHDSLLFKNIADAPLEKILNLYKAQTDKQIIIAFDKNKAYSDEVEKITEETKVLRLDPGGNELYGRPWNKK